VINFTGTFTHDDDVQFFYYTVQVAGPVTVETTSFNGTPTGGFIPILSVFDSTGLWVFGDSGYASNTNASVTWVSNANEEYIVALTEWDNFPNTLNLADGFVEAGQGDFTANPPTNPGLPGGFYNGTCFDPATCQLTGNWAVTFTADDAAGLQASIPEPDAWVLAGAGLALMLGVRYLRGKSSRNDREA
jgi:hypothetical protein